MEAWKVGYLESTELTPEKRDLNIHFARYTFRVFKEGGLRIYRDHRTRLVALHAWDEAPR